MDSYTIDCTSSIQFRDLAAKDAWCLLINIEYFTSATSRNIMNFSRRFMKIAQHLMDHSGKNFSDAIRISAKEANADENIGFAQKALALELIISVWAFGSDLSLWLDNQGNLYDFLVA